MRYSQVVEKRKEAQRRVVDLEVEIAASAGAREEAQAARSRCNQLQVLKPSECHRPCANDDAGNPA